MPKSFILSIVTLFVTLVFFFSCKKSKNAPPPAKYTGCRIAHITQAGVDTTNKTVYSFFYNDDGTVHRIYATYSNFVGSANNKFFLYKDNYIKISTVRFGETSPATIDSLALDAQNRVVFINHIFNDPITQYPTWDNYQYDSSGNMILHTSRFESDYTTDTATLQWLNGDVTGYTINAGPNHVVTTYADTYSDTLYNTGNITARIMDFLNYGRAIYTSKHLQSSEICTTCGRVFMNYTYILDSAGKITFLHEIPVNGAQVNEKMSWITYACE